MKVSSKISLLHFLEVNRKTRNNIGNKSWRILDMAWVQRHMSVEGKKQSKSEVWCKAKRNTYPKRCDAIWLSTRWRSKLKGKSGRSGRSLDLSIHWTKTATPALDFVSPLLSALYISLPLVLKTRRRLAGKVSIHSRPAKVTLSAIYKTFIRAEITNQYPLPGST